MHLLDDPALGGVTRLLGCLLERLAGGQVQHRRVVRTKRSIAPRLDAAVIVVHFTMGWSKLPFLLTLRLFNPSARLILVEHTYTSAFEANCVSHRARFRIMLRCAYKLANQVVAVSRGQADWLQHAGLVAASRLRVIPCILDLTPFAVIPLPGDHAGPAVLGAFGRFHQQKGFLTLIEAMRLVPPQEARLRLGGYGELEPVLRAAAAGLPHVELMGSVDPVDFLSQSDAIVMPSLWEAGAVTCWEARAAGRPMIVSAVDGLPEQVPPTIGYVVAPGDVAALTAAIRQMASGDRGAMGLAARRSTEGAFDRVLLLWRDVLTQRAAD